MEKASDLWSDRITKFDINSTQIIWKRTQSTTVASEANVQVTAGLASANVKTTARR